MVNLLLNSGASLLKGKPVVFLTQWKIVGNSEVHGNEIWSCGEYNATDGKYHILVQPQGGSIADIALDEPLRKVNDVADTIEFTGGVTTLTRILKSVDMGDCEWVSILNNDRTTYRYRTSSVTDMDCPSSIIIGILLSAKYQTRDIGSLAGSIEGIGCYLSSGEPRLYCYDSIAGTVNDSVAFREHVKGVEVIYKLNTPTTELVDAPQIQEAESYSCVISQGGKAVEWSSFNGGILEFYDKITPTDNAYIDTGYIPSIDSKFVTHIKRVSLNSGCLYSNASPGKTDGIRFLLAGSKYYVSFGASRVLTEPNTNLDLTITHAHTEYLIINGNDNTYKTSVGNSYIAEPLTIFSDYYNRSISGTMAYFNGNSLYSFKIYENDVLVRDFKPCTYNGVAGLWDMVESKFYGNSNSVGTLTVSNDV